MNILTILIWLQGLRTETDTLFKEENDIFILAGCDGNMKRVHILVVQLEHGIREHFRFLVFLGH